MELLLKCWISVCVVMKGKCSTRLKLHNYPTWFYALLTMCKIFGSLCICWIQWYVIALSAQISWIIVYSWTIQFFGFFHMLSLWCCSSFGPHTETVKHRGMRKSRSWSRFSLFCSQMFGVGFFVLLSRELGPNCGAGDTETARCPHSLVVSLSH